MWQERKTLFEFKLGQEISGCQLKLMYGKVMENANAAATLTIVYTLITCKLHWPLSLEAAGEVDNNNYSN